MKSVFGATLFLILTVGALNLPSSAAVGPVSAITSPKYLLFINGTSITNSFITVTGTATSDTGTLSKVEVSVNEGSWRTATGTGSWSYRFQVHASGLYLIQSRATDSLGNEENPGGGVLVDVVLPSATGSISGTVSYSGMKGGDFIVGAFTDPTYSGGNAMVFTDIGGTPGAYMLSPVPPGTFYVGAVKTVPDPKGGFNIQATDPVGAYGTVAAPTAIHVPLSGSPVTGKNITLANTSANPLSMPARVQALYGPFNNVPQMRIAFEFMEPDPINPASSVSVKGPGIPVGSPISLGYDSSRGRWSSYGPPDISLFLAGPPNTWPTLPATYTFTVNGGAGTGTRTSAVKSYLTDLPTGVSPSGDVSGSVVFSWAPVPMASFYEVRLYDPGNNNQQIWKSGANGSLAFTGTSYKYDGSALMDGHTYSYAVFAADKNNSGSVTAGGFIYHNSNDTTPPTSSITSPSDGWLVSGDYLVSSGISGTAQDDAAGMGVERVEVSLDGGTNWFPATDTSLLQNWATWNIKPWPSPGPSANIPLLNIKSRAIDGANNFETPSAGINIIVDVTIPAAAFTSPKNNAYVTTLAPTITGTASDTGTGVYSADFSPGNNEWHDRNSGVTDTSGNGSWSTWSYLWHVPVDGFYTLLCHAVDWAGNQPSPAAYATINVIVDTTPPSTTIATPSDGAYITTGPVIITGTSSDATSGVAKVEVSTNGGTTWTTLPGTATSDNWAHWRYSWPLPADGVYTIKSRATDKAGNVESVFTATVNMITVTVDKTKPAVAITAPAANAWVMGTSFTVKGTASDATSGVDTVSVSIDGGAWTPVTTGTTSWTYNWNPLPADGAHKLQAKATDKAGNFQMTAIISVKVDGHAPSSSMTQPLNGVTLNGVSYIIKGTATDGTGSGVKKVEVLIDGTPFTATGTTSWSYTWPLPSSPGSFNIQSRATDIAGNVETPGGGVTVTADKSSPASAITAPVTGKALRGASAAITGTATAGASATSVTKVEVKVVNAITKAIVLDWTQATGMTAWSYNWNPLPLDGSYAIISRATNNLPHLEDTTNKAGNTVTVDNTAPTSTITAPAGGAILKGTTVPITGTAGDYDGSGVVKVEVSTNNGSTWAAATDTSAGHDWSSWSYTWKLGADGPYTLKARGTDKAGNVQIAGIPSVSVRVDKTKPTVALTTPLNGVSISKALNNWSITGYPVTGTASDGATGSGVALVEVGITPSGGATTWSPATGTTSWSFPWMLPADGSYNIKARSTDFAGNLSLITAGNTVKVDSTPPSVVITQPLNNRTVNTATYTIKGAASDNLSGLKKVEVSTDGGTTWKLATGMTAWSYAWTPLGNSQYGIQCRATDNAGNISTSQITVTVDKTMPASVITAPAAGKALGGTSATITGTATAGASGGTVTRVEVKVINANTSAVVLDWTQAAGTTAWSYTWTPLPPDGSYTIMSRATNSLGNTQGTTPQWGNTVTVDTTPPTSVITDPAASDVLKGTTVPITGTADDGAGSGVTKVEVSTNNGSTWVAAKDTSTGHDWSSWSYTWTLGADGPYTLKSRATDKAGNVQTAFTPANVRIDKTRPTSAITAPVNGALLSGASKTITGTASDGATGSGVQKVEVSTDGGGTWTTLPPSATTDNWAHWSFDWTLPADGSYNIKSRATDNGGNVQIPGAGNTVKVDNTPPTVAITAPPDGTVITGTGIAALSRTVTGTASDAGTGLLKVEVSFDGGATWKPATGTSSWTYAWTITTTDVDSIWVRATDKALNANTATAAVLVSPKLFSGTWSFTYTPPPGQGSAQSGTIPLAADDLGNVTITEPNACHTLYTGTFTGMTAALTTTNGSIKNNSGVDTCNAAGSIALTFTDMRHATGSVTGPDGTGTVKLSR